MTQPTQGYKEMMQELQEILEAMQGDSLDVDAATTFYERGQTLLARLESHLKTAENTIQHHALMHEPESD